MPRKETIKDREDRFVKGSKQDALDLERFIGESPACLPATEPEKAVSDVGDKVKWDGGTRQGVVHRLERRSGKTILHILENPGKPLVEIEENWVQPA